MIHELLALQFTLFTITYKETHQINAFYCSKWDKAYVLILFKLYILYFYSPSSLEQISNPATGLPTLGETETQ